jgi:hypothetical protein
MPGTTGVENQGKIGNHLVAYRGTKKTRRRAPKLSDDVLDERYVIAGPDCSEGNHQTHGNALDAHTLTPPFAKDRGTPARTCPANQLCISTVRKGARKPAKHADVPPVKQRRLSLAIMAKEHDAHLYYRSRGSHRFNVRYKTYVNFCLVLLSPITAHAPLSAR